MSLERILDIIEIILVIFLWITMYYYYFKRSDEQKRKDDEVHEEIVEEIMENFEQWFGSWGVPLFVTLIMLAMAFHGSLAIIGLIEGIRQLFTR